MATGVEAATSSHIEEMIKELAQPEGLEVPATGMLLEGITSLPKDLRLWILLGKRTKIFHILSFSSLLLTLVL